MQAHHCDRVDRCLSWKFCTAALLLLRYVSSFVLKIDDAQQTKARIIDGNDYGTEGSRHKYEKFIDDYPNKCFGSFGN
jgi:hypothetical protein